MPKVKTKAGQENKLIHPKSRKAAQISRQLHREIRVEKKKKEGANRLVLLGEKIAWFKDQIQDEEDISASRVMELIEEYLGRFDDELEQITIKSQVGHRQSRQHASREDVILHTKKMEKEEYEGCGFEIPDLLCPKNVEELKTWNKELRFIQNIALKRFSKKDLQQRAAGQGTSTTERTAEEMETL